MTAGTLDLTSIPALSDAWKAEIRAMIRFLAGYDQDGARYQNGVGFNGHDSAFGRDMAHLDDSRWTDGHYRGCYRLLRKYAGTQLPGGGYDYGALGSPDELAEAHETNPRGLVELDGDALVLRFPYSSKLVAAVKNLPSRKFDNGDRSWRVPAYLIRSVRALAAAHGLALSPDVEAMADHDPDKVPVTVIAAGDLLRIRFPYNSKLVAVMRQVAGAAWDKESTSWSVPIESAADLVQHLTRAGASLGDAGAQVIAAAEAVLARIAASRALDAELEVAGLGLELHPFQKAAVAYIIEAERPSDRRVGCIVGHEMGLGKTPICLAATQALNAYPAVGILPQTIIRKWTREIHKTLPGRKVLTVSGTIPAKLVEEAVAALEARPHVLHGTGPARAAAPVDLLDALSDKDADPFFGRLHTTADLRSRKDLNRTIPLLRHADIILIHYDVVYAWAPVLAALRPNGVWADESHFLKESSARRTAAATEVADAAQRMVLALTGTAVLNRREEYAAQLRFIGRLSEFGEKKDIRKDESISRHLRARCFTRALKKEVRPELPPRQYVPVEVDGEPAAMKIYDRAETDFLGYLKEWALEKAHKAGVEDPTSWAMEKVIKASAAEQLVQISHLRHLAATAKMPAGKTWVREFLDGGDEKLLIFAHRIEILEDVAGAFDSPLIYGATSADERDNINLRFQEDPRARLVTMGITVGGVGLDLTASSNVLFVEHPWSPMVLDQCVDRCYGRLNDCHGATGWELLCAGTIDIRIQALLAEKRIECENSMDGDEYGDDAPEGKTSVLADLVWSMAKDVL